MAPSYRLGKGPIVVQLEAALRDVTTFDALYDDLARALGELDSLGHTTFRSSFKTSLAETDRDHLNKDVFGEGQVDPEAVADGAERRRVYYSGLRQAMDLARTLGSAAAPAPIQVLWGCGQRHNECWISWERAGGAPNITLVMLSTDPAVGEGHDDNSLVQTPAALRGDPAQKGLVVVRPTDADGVGTFEPDKIIGV